MSARSGESRYTPASSAVSKPTRTFGWANRGIAPSTLSNNFGLSFDAQPAAFTCAVSLRENSFCSVTFVYNHRAMEMVAGVELIRPGAAEFGEALETILGRVPDDVLKPALPYSVIARN